MAGLKLNKHLVAYTNNFSHVTEELLEEYRFNRLRSSEADKLEEHLLICERCRAEWSRLDEMIDDLQNTTGDTSVSPRLSDYADAVRLPNTAE
jgi:hypothetical protein